MKKKIIAYVVSAVMVLTMVPATAFAATGTDDGGVSKTAPDALTKAQEAAIAGMEDALEGRNTGGGGNYYTSTQVAAWKALIADYSTKIRAATTTAQVNKYVVEYGIEIRDIVNAVTIIGDYANLKIETYGAKSTPYADKINEISGKYKGKLTGDLTDTEVDAIVSEAKAKMDAVTIPADADKIDAAVAKYTALLDSWVDDTYYEGATFDDEEGSKSDITLDGATYKEGDPVAKVIEIIIDYAKGEMQEAAVGKYATVEKIEGIQGLALYKLKAATGTEGGIVDDTSAETAEFRDFAELARETLGIYKGSKKPEDNQYSAYYPSSERSYQEAIKVINEGIKSNGKYFVNIWEGVTSLSEYVAWKNDPSKFDISYDAAGIKEVTDQIDYDVSLIPKGADRDDDNADDLVIETLKDWINEAKYAGRYTSSEELAELKDRYDGITQEITTSLTGNNNFIGVFEEVLSLGPDGNSNFAQAIKDNDKELSTDIKAEMSLVGDDSDAAVNSTVTNTNYNDIAAEVKRIEAMFEDYVDTVDADTKRAFESWSKKYMSGAETVRGVGYYKTTLTKEFIEAVNELSEPKGFNPADTDAWEAAEKAYANLSDEMKKEDIKGTNGTTMAEALTKYADYEAVAAPIMNAIVNVEKLMDQATATDEASVKAAWDAYKALPEDSQNAVDSVSKAKFDAVRGKVLADKGGELLKMATDITDYTQVTKEFVDAYDALVAEYEYYGIDSGSSALSAAASDIRNYNTNIVKDFKKAIDDIKNAPDKAVAGDAAAIKAARAIYDGMLTDEAKKDAKRAGYVAQLEKYEAAVSQYDLSKGSMTLSATEITLGDAAPTVAVKDATGKDLVADTDYTATYTGLDKVGEATVTVTGAGSYTGTLEAKITVKAIDLSKGSMTLSATEITIGDDNPTVVVKDAAGKELVADTDYTVAYTGFDQVGEATVTVTGTGNYTGTLEAKVTVKAVDIDISNGKVIMDGPSIEGGYSYIERGETPDIAVHVDGQPIPETAYTVDFNDKAYAGLTSLTVRANDGSGYDGELTYSYVVVNGAKNIKSLKAGTKSFAVKYSDYSKYGCTGTQIAWKTSKNGEWKYSKITSNDASKKVTVKAAGKKYVKVRAIVKVDGVRYYGDWSKTKTVTVR